MIRLGLNLIIAWITIFSVCLGIFTYNETNTYSTPPRIWQHGEYIDGTVVLRIISSDPNKTSTSTTGVWTKPVLSLRIIHPNGTVNEKDIDKDLEIQEFNWFIFTIPDVTDNQDPINVYALQRGYLIVRYFRASNTTDITTYEEWGRIIDWNGNLYKNGIWYPSLTAIVTNVDPSKGFIRTAAENATYVEWQQYMIGTSAVINIIATVDEGYSIIMGNSINSTNSDNLLEIYATVHYLKIGYNGTQFDTPKLLYQSSLPNITISRMFCGFSSTQVCILNVIQTQNNGTQSNVKNYYVKLDFLSSGSVIKITPLISLPNLPLNYTTGWQVESIPYGGYLFYGYFQDANGRNNAYGYYYNEIEDYYKEWDFPEPSVLNSRGTLIIMPNNTLLVSLRENNNTWSFNTTDIPNYSGLSDNGYLNLLVNSTSPRINSNITKDTKNITITYHEPVELSDGFIWIYRIVDKFTTQNVTRQFVNGNIDEFCSISDDGLTVIVEVIRSTFSYPNSQYYVKVDNNFVRSKLFGEPLMGIDDNIWKFYTSFIEEPFAGTTSGAMRLTAEGTLHYYNLNSTRKNNFFQDIIIELSKILSISSNRLSTSEKIQVDNVNSQIFIELRIQSSRTERSVKSIMDDLNEMIKYKRITSISLFPNTHYLDKDYGFVPSQNLWEKYKLTFVVAMSALGILVVLFLLAYKKIESKNGKDVKELYIPR
ncbi:3349_t:CDS:2 [Diversispora eburnea]|uniref:3349_t:CDS:1 n=1 Tax=Diversispora eburnea TaxID=1213867 RepID=A0A9N9C0N3_9GLOM|nr:3349_t:CDS:2 [Diversispora eburnea]